MQFRQIRAIRRRGAGSAGRARRRGLLLVGVMAIALSASIAACSSSSPSPGVANVSSSPTSSQSSSANSNGNSGGGPQLGSGSITVAFSQCMRSHGEPKFPDPNAQGAVSALQAGINPNTPQFEAAEKACASLANGPAPSSQQNSSQNETEALKFSSCMRSHGFPSFPDPASNGEISLSSGNGIDPTSPQFQSAQKTCSKQTGFGTGASLGSGS